MTPQLFFQLVSAAVPQTDVTTQASRHQGLLCIDGKDIADRTRVALLLRISLVKGIPSRNSAFFFEGRRVVDVNDRI